MSLSIKPSVKGGLTPRTRTILFLGGCVLITSAAVWLVSSTLVITRETRLASFLWVAGFGFLFFNVAYQFVLSLCHLLIGKPPVLKESYVHDFPKVALVYPVRNEMHGLLERAGYSFSGNKLPNVDLWILSDSAEGFEMYEREVVEELLKEHPGRVFYRRRKEPVERKQGNIAEFLHAHPEYSLLYICDADGMVPKGALLKLLKKALHPENRDIAIFQAFVKIAHAATWYARLEKIGADLSQRFSFTAFQAVFGRTISFGHHHLARAALLRKIRLPRGLLSHDNWDTVLLDQMGYRVAFCTDVYAFDEAPSNYLEARARSRRWSQGTLQGSPLVWKPGISLASRFLAFYGIYVYWADLVFFLWVILGVLAHSEPVGELIHFEIDSIWFGFCTNSALKGVLFFSLLVVVFHKVTILKTSRDFKAFIYEAVFSMLITLNNFVYAPLDMITIPIRKLQWNPMKKDPFTKINLGSVARELWLGTAFGFYGFYFCSFKTPYFVWQAAPILASLSLSILTVYLTSKTIPEGWEKWTSFKER